MRSRQHSACQECSARWCRRPSHSPVTCVQHSGLQSWKLRGQVASIGRNSLPVGRGTVMYGLPFPSLPTSPRTSAQTALPSPVRFHTGGRCPSASGRSENSPRSGLRRSSPLSFLLKLLAIRVHAIGTPSRARARQHHGQLRSEMLCLATSTERMTGFEPGQFTPFEIRPRASTRCTLPHLPHERQGYAVAKPLLHYPPSIPWG